MLNYNIVLPVPLVIVNNNNNNNINIKVLVRNLIFKKKNSNCKIYNKFCIEFVHICKLMEFIR